MGSAKLLLWEFGTEAQQSKTEVHSANLDNTNIVAQLGLFSDFRDAVAAVSIGNPGAWAISAAEGGPGRNPSATPAAQRENKWLVSYVDNVTGLPGSFTIPCYDPDLLATDGSAMAAGAERTALIAATEAFVLSNALNPVTVTSIKFRARTI